ncbi:hypothetical protein [Sulfobacillus harzensis]|uniref:Uncharacterized protein n=1 Tax=Sulfobacillus harzensis TaxID=2729629 RepID=A0A7Y0Q341_9FIRM|nr:hypothetical protein [Sulfobacillus harzensis]NMP23823.1 hypothetical protein [Sulfobacillus harzensis]
MARGLEVLQAALNGKRVRMGPRYGWLRWCPTCHTLEPSIEHGGHALPYGVTVHELWHENWEIEEPTLTFTEAVAAMDAGQTVERITTPELAHLQMRRQGDEYETRTILADGRTTAWGPILISSPAMLATDWRVVKEMPQDERPTAEELAQWLRNAIGEGSGFYPAVPPMLHGLEQAAQRWPGMFRKELL